VEKKGYHYLYFRPFLHEFLNAIQKFDYQLVFYTSGKSNYAKWIVQHFKMRKPYTLFTRRYTKTRYTDFGIDYLKSSRKIHLPTLTKEVIVLDDRNNLWEDNGETFMDISPWNGEVGDTALKEVLMQILIKDIKVIINN
jgi:TFIIF-interacting CTD phosphatase-like protein